MTRRSGDMVVTVRGHDITVGVHEEPGDRLAVDIGRLPEGVTSDEVAEAVVKRVEMIREDERREAAEWGAA